MAKLGGILLERSGDRVVVGFGRQPRRAPEDRGPGRGGAQWRDAAAGVRAPARWKFRAPARRCGAPASLRHSRRRGSRVRIRSAPGSRCTRRRVRGSTGTFDGIEPDGALRLRREDGKHRGHPRRRRRALEVALSKPRHALIDAGRIESRQMSSSSGSPIQSARLVWSARSSSVSGMDERAQARTLG